MTSRRAILGASAAAAAGGALPVALSQPEPVLRRFSLLADLAPPPTPSPNGNYLLHHFGDSITEGLFGSSTQDGMRKTFLDALAGPNELHNVQAVGSRVTGNAQLHHDGWGGKTVPWMIQQVKAGLLNNPAPANAGPAQFVIWQGGVNDFGNLGGYRTPDQVMPDVLTLLNLILALSANTRIVVGEQIACSGSINHDLTQNSFKQRAYNRALPGVVAATTDPSRIVTARWGLIPQEDLADGIHPNDRGYLRADWLTYMALPQWVGQYGSMANRPCPFPFNVVA